MIESTRDIIGEVTHFANGVKQRARGAVYMVGSGTKQDEGNIVAQIAMIATCWQWFLPTYLLLVSQKKYLEQSDGSRNIPGVVQVYVAGLKVVVVVVLLVVGTVVGKNGSKVFLTDVNSGYLPPP